MQLSSFEIFQRGERFLEPSGGDLERAEPQDIDLFLLFK